MKKLMSIKVLTILSVLAIILVAGVTVFAATTLNQTVGVTVTINSAGGGGGGGGTTSETAYIYNAETCAADEVLSTLTYNYTEGGNSSYTAYMKNADVTALGLVEGNTLTVEDSALIDVVITATVGAPGASATPLTIRASSGSVGIHSGNVVFSKS